MKLIFNMKILLFFLTSLFLIFKVKSFESENYELEGQDLISFLLKNEDSLINPKNTESATQGKQTQALPHLKPQEIDLPDNYGSLLKGYTFIFGEDDPSREFNELDEFDSYEVALLVYRNNTKHDKVGRLAFDLREFAWKCGPKKTCPLGNLYSNIKDKEIDVNAFKSQVNLFLSKINGISKVCVGDTYTDPQDKLKAVVFCFNSQDDLTAFEKLFHYVNIKDLSDSSKVFNPESEETFELHFTDGHDVLIHKNINFKIDGMYVKDKLLMKYDAMETFDGKKCNIAQNMPIVPIKFLDVKIFTTKCVAKFKYNKIDTYIGSTDNNCINILNYVTTKMSSSCNKVKAGPLNKFSNELVSRPTEGRWTGWVRHHKVMDNGGTIDPSPFKLVINPDIIEIFDKQTISQEKVDHKNITWSCNDDGDCSIKDFMLYLNQTRQNSKLNDFRKVITDIAEKWMMQDYNHCFVLEENDIHLICPIDYSEEYSVKTALAVAMDKKLIDAEASLFMPTSNGSTYQIIYSTDTNINFDEHSVTVLPEGVKDKNGEILIDYKRIKSLKNIPCGFEYRRLSLPNQYHEINPFCCAKFFTDENNFICMQQQSKCYISLRHMIQLIRTNCLLEQGVNSNFTDSNSDPLKPGQDSINTKSSWSGEVVFQAIDNFKNKGESVYSKGYLALDTSNATYTVNNEKVYSFPLESLNFNCESPNPCLVNDYISNQMPFLDKGLDRDWQQSSFAKFWEQNKNIAQKDCMVLVSDDSYYGTSTMILTCTTTKGQGESMRRSVTEVYNQKVEKLKGTDKKELKNIPSASDGKEFQALVIAATKDKNINNIQGANTHLKVALDGIIYKASGEILFKYTDVISNIKNTTNLKFDIKSEIPSDMIKQKVNPSCCFKVWSSADSNYFICLTKGDKCYHDKAIFFKTVDYRAERALSLLEAEIKSKAFVKQAKVKDPFSFGLGPQYKKFPKEYNFDYLNEQTFDQSKNGIWEGWVYETALTDRNFNIVVSPVWMEIANGIIKFKTDEDAPESYKELKISEYDQICLEHCQPREYIKRKKAQISDYDDLMNLGKSVENILGQLKNAYVEEGCVILDFVSPLFQFGHTDMICGVDKMQGDKIRDAIDKSYYQSLLDLDIDSEVRRPNLITDKFFSRIIINEKYNENFNNIYFDENGIIGRKVSNDVKVKQPLSKDIFNITYAQIAEDNFGLNCAFWYKNMKIKQKTPLMKDIIPDNNCCFKFYTKNDKKKVEICTYHQDGLVCIKQAREIMKGMKMGCIEQQKISTDRNVMNDDQKDQNVDLYQAKTIDDSENGGFEGFVYFGSAIQSSQVPKPNPYYMKVHKMSIEFYEDNTKTDKATISLNLENLQFNCEGDSPCSTSKFLQSVQSNPKYMSMTSQIQTVYGLFKDAYGLSSKFEEICFIIETSQTPYLMCPYIPETTASMKKAFVNAYIQNYSCRKLSSVPDSSVNATYHVIISEDGKQKEDNVKVTIKGVISTINNSTVLNYRQLDADPVDKKKRCAIWFKEVQIKFDFPHPECCFMVSVQGKSSTFCVKDKKICVGSAFKLMKSIWNGCMYNLPTQTVMKPSPDSEILGESSWKHKIAFDSHEVKYDVCSSERNNTIFNHSLIQNDYIVDLYNDVAYSLNKTLYKGWFNVYPIDVSTDSTWHLQNFYGELTPEGFKFYKSDKDKSTPKMVVRPDMLSMACGNQEACKPLKFLEFLSSFNSSLSYLKNTLQSKLDLFETRSEEGCAVLESVVANIPNYYIICAHIKKTRTTNPQIQEEIDNLNSYIKSRSLLSAHYGKIIRTIVYDAYTVSRKFLTQDKLPEGEKNVKEASMSLMKKRIKFPNVTITDIGIVSGNNVVVNFDDVQHCRVRYNLIYAPKDILYDNKTNCCFRYMGLMFNEYVCLSDMNCEYSTFLLAKKFYKGCVEKKKRDKDMLINELTTGENFYAMTIIKQVFKNDIKYTDLKSLNPGDALSTTQFKIKHKTLAIKYLFKLKELIHSINLIDISKSKKTSSNSLQDDTPVDNPSPNVLKITSRYFGESNDFKITAADHLVTQYVHKKTEDTLTVINNIQYIKTKEFSAVIANKSEYALLIYKDDGNKLIEITKSGVLLTNHITNLSSEIKSIEPYVHVAGIELQQTRIKK